MSNQKILQIAGSWRTNVVLGLVCLLIAACAPQPGSMPITGDGQTPEAESNLADTKWMLVSFGQSGAETPVIVGSSITLEFDSPGQAGGSGGCNTYGTQYRVQGNMISFGEITRTLMACEQEGIGGQEERYLRALESAGMFELSGDRLTIWYGDQGNKLNYVAATSATPTAPSTPPSASAPTAPLAPIPTAGTGSSRERVEFEPGAVSATRRGVLPEGGVKEYVLRAFTGQLMHVQTVGQSAPVEFTLISPTGATWTSDQQASDVNISTAEVILAQNGEYLVRLWMPQRTEATHYEIIFTIESGSLSTIPSPAESPETVNFAPGAISAQRSGTLPSGPALKQYALAGKAGQKLTVEINNADVPISISFTTPSGLTGFRSGHKFMLDDTGIYVVTLSKTGETPSTDYTIVFTIQ